MTHTVSSPVPLGANTGFTTPTATLVSMTAPNANSKSWAATAFSGCPGVTAHSVSAPATVTMSVPAVTKTLPYTGSTSSLVVNVPKNRHLLNFRKATTPGAGYSPRIDNVQMAINISAGAETYDMPNVRALMSLASGVLWQQCQNISDTIGTGIQ